jgi:hypothetical protein
MIFENVGKNTFKLTTEYSTPENENLTLIKL